MAKKKQTGRQKNPSAKSAPASRKLQSQTPADSASSAGALKPTKLEREGIKKFPELAGNGLYPRYVEADGNCMFRALADQLNGSDAEHRRIRAEVCDYISAHRTRFEGFVMDMDFDDYVARMRDELWGDGCALVAFAKIRGVNVIVYSEGLGAPPMRIGCNDDADDAASDAASSVKLRRRKGGKEKAAKVRESAVAAKRMRNSSSRKRPGTGASNVNGSGATSDYMANDGSGGAEYLGKRRPTLYLALDEEEHYWSVRRIAGSASGASDIDPNLEGAFWNFQKYQSLNICIDMEKKKKNEFESFPDAAGHSARRWREESSSRQLTLFIFYIHSGWFQFVNSQITEWPTYIQHLRK